MENATSLVWTFCPDHSTVHLDNVPTNSQTQSEAIDFPCETHIDAMETIEDALKMLRGDADPRIDHTDFQHTR